MDSSDPHEVDNEESTSKNVEFKVYELYGESAADYEWFLDKSTLSAKAKKETGVWNLF